MDGGAGPSRATQHRRIGDDSGGGILSVAWWRAGGGGGNRAGQSDIHRGTMSGPIRLHRWLTILISPSGVCLSELMVALAIGTLVLAGSLEAFNMVQAQAVRQQRIMAAQQEMRVGLEVFEQEVRMASSSTIVVARSDRFEFSPTSRGCGR